MSLGALHGFSLRNTLFLALFPGLLLILGAELWQTWRTAVDAANAAYDRSLLGAIKAIDANISTASGGLGVELPYRMLEFFELTASGEVFYRVASDDGLVEIGNVDLPPPTLKLRTEEPQFAEAVYYGKPVRIGSYARMLSDPIAGQGVTQRVVIQVAETLASRNAFTRVFVLQALARDMLMILAAIVLIMVAVSWSLRPVVRLRTEVQARSPQDLAPISTQGIPTDVQPLVEAINFHIERNQRQGESRRRFIDDASHQIRTPLTTLATQVDFALRSPDPVTQQGALTAIKSQLDETIRQANQMLALARAENVDLCPEKVDMRALAEKVSRQCWATARDRGLDLGFESPAGSLIVTAQASLLQEALANLIHNAIGYVPSGGHITVSAARIVDAVVVTVLDDGPGIPAAELTLASQRFFRGSNAAQAGTGLGLAIVKSIVERHGGRLVLQPGPRSRGLSASLYLPAA